MDKVLKPHGSIYVPPRNALVPKMCKNCHQVMEIKQINLTEAVRQCYKCSASLQCMGINDIEFFHRSYRDMDKDPEDWGSNLGTEEDELNELQSWIEKLQIIVSKYEEDCSDDDELPAHTKTIADDIKVEPPNDLVDVNLNELVDSLKTEDVNPQGHSYEWNNNAIEDLDAALESISNAKSKVASLPFDLEELFPSNPDAVKSSPLPSTHSDRGCNEREEEVLSIDLQPTNNPRSEYIENSFSKDREAEESEPSVVYLCDVTGEAVFESRERQFIKEEEIKHDEEESVIPDGSGVPSFLSSSVCSDIIDQCLSRAETSPTWEAESSFSNVSYYPSPSRKGAKGKSLNATYSSICQSSFNFSSNQICECEDELTLLPIPLDDEYDHHCLVLKLPNLSLTPLKEYDEDEMLFRRECKFPSELDKVLFSPLICNMKKRPLFKKSVANSVIELKELSPNNRSNTSSSTSSTAMTEDSGIILITIPASEDITSDMLGCLSGDDLPIIFEDAGVLERNGDTTEYQGVAAPVIDVNKEKGGRTSLFHVECNGLSTVHVDIDTSHLQLVNSCVPEAASEQFNGTREQSVEVQSCEQSKSKSPIQSHDDSTFADFMNSLLQESCETVKPQNDEAQQLKIMLDLSSHSIVASENDDSSVFDDSLSHVSRTSNGYSSQHEVFEDSVTETFDELKSFTGAKFKSSSMRKKPLKPDKFEGKKKFLNFIQVMHHKSKSCDDTDH